HGETRAKYTRQLVMGRARTTTCDRHSRELSIIRIPCRGTRDAWASHTHTHSHTHMHTQTHTPTHTHTQTKQKQTHAHKTISKQSKTHTHTHTYSMHATKKKTSKKKRYFDLFTLKTQMHNVMKKHFCSHH